MTKTKERRSLTQAVGWLSIGLGAGALIAPKMICRLVGLGRREEVIRAVGVRELACGAGILLGKNPLPWSCARVVGDIMDIGLLAGDTSGRPSSLNRTIATSVISGISLFDLAAVKESYRAGASTPLSIRRTLTINKPREELYSFWRTLSNLPHVFSHVVSVEELDEKTSHWIVKGPGGKEIEWRAEITEERENEVLSWRTLDGASVPNAGSVTFRDAPYRGTEVTVDLEYDPPLRLAGVALATLLGEEPEQQLKSDLRQFKQLMEAGEVATTRGQPAGRGRGETWLDRITH